MVQNDSTVCGEPSYGSGGAPINLGGGLAAISAGATGGTGGGGGGGAACTCTGT